MANNQITPFQLTDQFTMDNFNQRINETNIALQKKADITKKTTVTLSINWTGDASPYTQTVTISGTTANSKVDLQQIPCRRKLGSDSRFTCSNRSKVVQRKGGVEQGEYQAYFDKRAFLRGYAFAKDLH